TPDELNKFLEAGWWVVGPYPYDLKIPCPPEVDADPARPVAAFPVFPAVSLGPPLSRLSLLAGWAGAPQLDWKPCPTDLYGTVKRGHPVLERPGGPVSVYGLTYVYSPDERPATLLVGGDLMRVWLNGQLVHEMKNIINDPFGRRGAEGHMDQVPVTLKPGRNTLLVKANDRDGGFWFRVRLADNPMDRGMERADLGLWKESATAFSRWQARNPPDEQRDAFWYSEALVRVLAGDVERYRRHCEYGRLRYGDKGDLRPYLLVPEGAPDTAWLVQAAKKIQEAAPKEHWHLVTLGIAHYRAGQYEAALRHIERAREIADWIVSWPALAMTYHRLGQTDKAREWLQKIDQHYQRELEGALTRTPFRLSSQTYWEDGAFFEIFRREAKQLIEGRPPDDAAMLAPVRARAWAELGEHAKAQAELDQAIKLKPDDVRLRIARGRFHAERGDHKKADTDFAKAATLTPQELNKFLEAGWWVVGPYPGDPKTSHPLEKNPDPSKPAAALASPAGIWSGTRAWQFAPTVAPYGRVNLGATFGNSANVSAYALTYITSPDERSAMLLVGGGDAVRLWLNGRLVHEMPQAHGWWVGLDRVPVTLRAGRNTLLAKVSNVSGRQNLLFLDVRLGDSPLDRGLALAEMGLWQEAAPHFIKGFEKQVDSEPHFSAPVVLLSGRVEAYRRLCAGLLTRFGDTADPDGALHVAMACGLAPQGAKDTAHLLKLAKKAQRPEVPAERWRLFFVGLAHYRSGQFEQAIRFFEENTDTPSSVPSMAVLAMAHHRLGHAEEARKWFKRAEESYNSATEEALAAAGFKMPHSMWWEWAWTEVFYREARAVLEGGAPKEGAKQAALAARARQELKRRDKATAAYDHALMLYPDLPRLWLARGRRHAELKRWKEADADLDQAAKLKPDDPQVWAERGRVYAEHGQPDKAAAAFAKVFELVPEARAEDLAVDSAGPWWSDPVGLDADLARWEEAFAALVKQRPKDKRVWIGRVRGLARRAQWQKALDALAKLIELDPSDHSLWYHDAVLRLPLGDRKGYRQ
ncbi:MAG TPA: tetratricopeptide repeat protein, partial [Gemmataceae bacterium]|nr:tetratricopeptide repeat protein [Gemmataceae bacterium]